MIPQVPEYLVTSEASIRPLVAAIALGLIWMGATRMEGPAQSRYATAGVMSVVLIAWLAVAQYLGSANAYLATSDNAVPTVLFGLLIPLLTAAVGPAVVGKHCKPRLRNTAALDRGGPGLSHRRWHLPRPLGGWTPPLAIRAAGGDWRRHDGHRCRRCGSAAGAKGTGRSEGGLRLVPFRNR